MRLISQEQDHALDWLEADAKMNGMQPPAWTAADLPRGTVTFLFTDIVGSTRIAQVSQEAYRLKLEEHRRIIRLAVAAHSGLTVGHEGDSFFVSFERASDALAAAEEARGNLEQEIPSLPVRFGIHTGEVVVTDDGYIGLTIHQARRICDAANGGQILVSQTTASLVSALPEGAVLEDIGRHRLKDLGDQVHLFELRLRDTPGPFRPPRSLDTVPNNLPIQLTNLVGRHEDLKRVMELLRASRLVTITGFGGVGKTRLAHQVASRCLELYPDGVWSAELTTVSDPTLVPSTVARSLGIGGPQGEESEKGTPTEQIARSVGAAQTMLLIDNCEHVVDECASFVHQLLSSCPALTVLATSRQALAVPGEALYPLRPLETSSPGGERSEAVEMFIERALTRDPSLPTTPQDIQEIQALCKALDGIPLAIELAASRVGSMSPREILDQLHVSPLEIGVGSRTGADRHRTLRAAIDWSYALLSDPERLLLRRLTFMAGNFTSEAAREVCAERGLPPKAVPDLLSGLVEKSLLLPVRSERETSFRMLDSIKAYATEKLHDASGTTEAPTGTGVLRYRFQQEGEVWAVGEPGAEARLKHSRGFPLLLRLLQNPGSEIHALDLMGIASSEAKPPEGMALDTGSGMESLDSRARDQLRRRLEELAEEVREAEENNDVERRSLAETEMQQITDHLSEALGLAGRSRKTGSNAERARLAATKAIRTAIARIGAHDRAVGHLLSQSMKTGTFCSYEPPAVPKIEWTLS
ncbi:MAG: adenylate/guanylate cyclase domain-containing protein [Actinobacteria bacterium]|nr:adenylate/guanylate cyclase domain-containing protein [Actinomycetota bacterium]